MCVSKSLTERNLTYLDEYEEKERGVLGLSVAEKKKQFHFKSFLVATIRIIPAISIKHIWLLMKISSLSCTHQLQYDISIAENWGLGDIPF